MYRAAGAATNVAQVVEMAPPARGLEEAGLAAVSALADVQRDMGG